MKNKVSAFYINFWNVGETTSRNKCGTLSHLQAFQILFFSFWTLWLKCSILKNMLWKQSDKAKCAICCSVAAVVFFSQLNIETLHSFFFSTDLASPFPEMFAAHYCTVSFLSSFSCGFSPLHPAAHRWCNTSLREIVLRWGGWIWNKMSFCCIALKKKMFPVHVN